MTTTKNVSKKNSEKSTRESVFQAELMVALGSQPWIRIWRQNSGKFCGYGGTHIVGAPKGAADIVGILQGGRHIEIECKTTMGTLSVEQAKWREMVRAMGGIYVVAMPPVSGVVDSIREML